VALIFLWLFLVNTLNVVFKSVFLAEGCVANEASKILHCSVNNLDVTFWATKEDEGSAAKCALVCFVNLFVDELDVVLHVRAACESL